MSAALDDVRHRAAEAYQRGDFERARALFEEILGREPDNAKARNHLGVVVFQLGDPVRGLELLRESCAAPAADAQMWLNHAAAAEELGHTARAISCCERAACAGGDGVSALQRLAQIYLDAARWREAQGVLERLVGLAPRDPMTHVRMTRAQHELGRAGAAREHGERALALFDAAVPVARAPVQGPAAVPAPASRSGRDVIAFSLWGGDPRYLAGALANAELARALFPEWEARFYCDRALDGALLDALRARGARVVLRAPPARQPWRGLFWRFEPADDPGVRRYVCRDVDSRLSDKERAAVDAWVESGLPFHVMRDHPCHLEPVLAGMWGGTAGALPPLGPQVDRHLRRDSRRWVDQEFLRVTVWPLIRGRVLIHDSHYRSFGAIPFPEPRGGRFPCRGHVGSCVRPSEAERADLARVLGPLAPDARSRARAGRS